MDDNLIESLLYRSEDPSVDYKSEQYVFSKQDLPEDGLSKQEKTAWLETKKSELLKDVLAMANAWREGPAHILLGFKENKPHQPTLVGLDPSKLYDDAQFQQFIGSKVNAPLHFKYAVREYQGRPIGLITIERQQRPFYATTDYGSVAKNVVYVRRGSSTAIAEPQEIAAMGADHVQRKAEPSVRTIFVARDGAPIAAHSRAIVIPDFGSKPLPDCTPQRPSLPGLSSVTLDGLDGRRTDKDYWRKLAAFVRTRKQAVPILVRLSNDSPFVLNDCELHIQAMLCGAPVPLQEGDEQAELPEPRPFGLGLDFGKIRPVLAKETLDIRVESGVDTAVLKFEKILPGATRPACDWFSVFPRESGRVTLACTLYARELSKPVRFDHDFEVDASTETWDFEQLRKLDAKRQ